MIYLRVRVSPKTREGACCKSVSFNCWLFQWIQRGKFSQNLVLHVLICLLSCSSGLWYTAFHPSLGASLPAGLRWEVLVALGPVGPGRLPPSPLLPKIHEMLWFRESYSAWIAVTNPVPPVTDTLWVQNIQALMTLGCQADWWCKLEVLGIQITSSNTNSLPDGMEIYTGCLVNWCSFHFPLISWCFQNNSMSRLHPLLC